MGDSVKIKRRHGSLELLFPLLVAGSVLLFLTALGNVKKGSAREGREQLEQALRRCAVTCYAVEGVYPPSVEYMKEHYGIRMDEERYIVQYEVVAENLMPDITVLEKSDEK